MSARERRCREISQTGFARSLRMYLDAIIRWVKERPKFSDLKSNQGADHVVELTRSLDAIETSGHNMRPTYKEP